MSVALRLLLLLLVLLTVAVVLPLASTSTPEHATRSGASSLGYLFGVRVLLSTRPPSRE